MHDLNLINTRLADGRLVDIAIRAGLIDAVMDRVRPDGVAESGAAETIPVHDANGRLVLPSMAEPHAHLDKALTADRVANPAGDLGGAIDAWIAHGPELTVDDIEGRAEVAARRLIASGTTTIRTHVDVNGVVGLRGVEALIRVRETLRDVADIQLTALPFFLDEEGRPVADQVARVREALAMGVDHLGGCPHLESDASVFFDLVFELASAADVGLDLHVDETLDPEMLTLELLAERVTSTGLDAPVMASHCVSLGVQAEAVQRRVADKVAAADIGIVALPQTNLFLQARGLLTAPPRGLTAIDVLLDAGADVAAGADNVEDPFNLMGRSDPFETAALLVMAGHRTPDQALDMVGSGARRLLGRPGPGIDLAPSSPADLLVVDAATIREAIAAAPTTRTVIRHGLIVSRREMVTS